MRMLERLNGKFFFILFFHFFALGDIFSKLCIIKNNFIHSAKKEKKKKDNFIFFFLLLSCHVAYNNRYLSGIYNFSIYCLLDHLAFQLYLDYSSGDDLCYIAIFIYLRIIYLFCSFVAFKFFDPYV